MAFGFFEPQKGQSAKGIEMSRAMAAALLRNNKAPANIGEGLSSIGDALLYRSLIGDADASEKAGTDAFNTQFNSLIAPYSGGGQASAIPMPTTAGEVAATAPGGSVSNTGVLPGSLLAALDKTEGGGGYDTLFGNAQKGKFAGTDVSKMSIADVLAFQDPNGPYAQSVKGQVGRVATPVGRHQIVGTTLRNAVGALGLDPSQTFDPATQDQVALYLAKNRVNGSDNLAGQMAGLRNEWEGFRNVPDAQLAQIIGDLKGGVQTAPVGNVEVASLDAPQTATDAINTVAPQTGYRDPQVTTAYANPAPSTAAAPQLPAPTTVSAPPAVAEAVPMPAPQQVAQNFQPQQIDPRLIEAANSPFATPGQKAILGGLIQQQQARNDFNFKQQQQQQLQAQTLAERVAVANQLGINPAYAQDEEVWKQAVSQAQGLAAPSVSTANGVGYDNRTGKAIFGSPDKPTSVQEYEYGKATPGFFEQQEQLRRSGASTTEGSIPTGYSAVRDTQGKITSYAPISGGPADTSAKTNASNDSKLTSTDVITNAANLARQALHAPGIGSTGTVGKMMSNLPESNAAELRRQVKVLTSNATIENLNAMRQQSPTGGALGNVTEGEGAMLAAKAGVLDPNSPTFERDLDDYERTMLRIIHGKDKGDQAYDQSRPSKDKPISEMTDEELKALANGD